ncbi:molybdenum cofactor guanylyltransferase [Paenibacillus sp. 1011MAR3C5]|uniref:molybdenum cofactor guanylyltransferase n=1 Tax=Paenibacillus sp. 1011MAR3C5 TaxID=1675787 RepID=UPI000E6CB650|nr:molybdenum cofactor guanylyltransferase [Paenibacillus sp. 1011MAR3C5]RJE85544.1 molybdenum cofactor guanylyltransferase [Paenibacillus sp. 1011MAR3C5]
MPDKLRNSVVLAGGQSSRMGQDKALLPIEGEPLLTRLVRQLTGVSECVTIATGTARRAESYREALEGLPFATTIQFAEDIYPGEGPLAGLHAGLCTVQEEGYVLVTACDMPDISLSLLQRLLEARSGGSDAIYVRGQPFHALYHTRVTTLLEEALEQRNLRVMGFLGGLSTTVLQQEIDCSEPVTGLSNLNTQEEYHNYLNRMRRDGS